MLILTRRVGESLFIGDEIEVKVLEVKGKQVVLGTTAPKRIRVHRGELKDRLTLKDRIKRVIQP